LILEADSISRRFGERLVLSSARLCASAGEVVGVLGRMGTGKSTLLKICAGIERPDSGWVRFHGRQYSRPRLSALAMRGMFYLGEANNLASGMTPRQHFDRIEKRFGRGDRARVVEFLGIAGLLDARIESLSGGEVRRVEIALAIIRRPLCLLADEPFRGLDPKVCELLGESLRLLAAQDCAVVITGHEVNTLKPFLDSVTWVTSGTTYDLGSADAAWANSAFTREYLGPTTRVDG
jgi:lipopolysaccharide export system ATP-binding protein